MNYHDCPPSDARAEPGSLFTPIVASLGCPAPPRVLPAEIQAAAPRGPVIILSMPRRRKTKAKRRAVVNVLATRRPRRRRAPRLRRGGQMGGAAADYAHFLSCANQRPSPFPDGSELPSMPFQGRIVSKPTITDVGGSGCFSIAYNVDAFTEFAIVGTPGALVGGLTDWTSGGSPQFVTNTALNSFQEEDIDSYRVTAARLCVEYVGSAFVDSGTINCQVQAPDWTSLANADLNNAYSVDPNNCLAAQVFMGPVRDGLELIVQPLDPRSRTYRPLTFLTTGTSDGATAIGQLQLRERIKWPSVVLNCTGLSTSAVGLVQVSWVIDYELQVDAASPFCRSMPSPAVDRPLWRQGLSMAYRAAQDAGVTMVSKAAAVAAGGLSNLLTQALSGVMAFGATRLASTITRGAPATTFTAEPATRRPMPRPMSFTSLREL
jgi:hypothetical protein